MTWLYWIAGLALLLIVIAISRRGEDGGPRLPGADDLGANATQDDIDALIRTGRKIEAIKVYRQVHGTDLKDSKDAVEDRARTLGIGK